MSQHDVVTVPTVSAALEQLRTGDFDVALVDYDLDGGKGDSFVAALRASPNRMPVVAVSARDEGNAALLQAGADAVCHKKDFRRISEVMESLSLGVDAEGPSQR